MAQLNPIIQIVNSFNSKCTLVLCNKREGYTYYNDDSKRILDGNVAPWQIRSMLKKGKWKTRED